MTTPEPIELQSFLQVWKSALVKVLTQMGAAGVKTADIDAETVKFAAPEENAMVAVRFSGGGSLKGQLQWSCEKSSALQCAQLLMSETPDPAVEFTATHNDGYLEFIRQVAGEVAVVWKEAKGAEVELLHTAEISGAFSADSTACMRLECGTCKNVALRLDLDAELVAALSAPPADPVPEETVAGTGAEPEGISGQPLHLPSNLDLILDVQLDATIRFGEREMLLQDVLGLMPGAVVELDQLVNEPAELLVAGRLVAKGEVVVVDGNFGLRVTEVVSAAQRAATLSLG